MAPAVANGSKKISFVPPRKISVQKFAETRGPELDALHSIVSTRLDGDFRCRRNKRRRTTAHDNQAAKRGPNKRRKLGLLAKTKQSATENESKKMSRRVRRRIEFKKSPEIGFVSSGDGTKRLRTHIWHAKRFMMTKRWGFYLPLGLQGRGRGSRAVLKWYKDGAVVHDASYFSAVQLEGPEDSLMSILKMVLVPSPLAPADDTSEPVLSGVVYATAMLHHVGAYVSKLITPVTYMWRPSNSQNRGNVGSDHVSDGKSEPQSSSSFSSHRQLWIWIHASAFREGYDALKLASQKQSTESGILINCYSLEGQVAKLELMGSKAFQLLQNILHPVSSDSDKSWQLKKCSIVEADHDSLFRKSSVLLSEESISSRSVLSLTVLDPRALPQKGIEDVHQKGIEDVSVPAPTGVPENLAKDDVTLPGISEETKLLVTSLSKCDATSCSRDIWDACSGVDPPVEENVLCLEKHHLRMNFLCLDDPKLERSKTSSRGHGSTFCPIILLKNKSQSDPLMGWSLILPLSWVKVFWSQLVTRGGHAIGQREKRWISSEVRMPLFPLDFPDCNAYSALMETEAAALDQKAERLPSNVRPFKIPMPSPWRSIYATLDKMFPILKEDQASSGKDALDDIPESNSKSWDCSRMDGDDNSFMGIVARTSTVLTDFINEVNGDGSLLFPQVPNRKTSFLKFMRDESKLGQAHNASIQTTSTHKLCFIRVLLQAYKEGVFEEGAVVCAPHPGDISLWTSRSENIEGGLLISESSVRSYFEEKFPGKWELHIPEDLAVNESHRWPIGFITTGFTRGSKKAVAQALCEASLLTRLRKDQWNAVPVKRRRKEIYVLVRNLRSTAYRLALATIILEQQVNDVEFL